ncbi:uncharacterized protein LOC127700774 [Mytilus californianus]|uniref:uncharacterized protein LOC127700774 n=1 Tax=Mytilus californianus TaxID=6549 RepID=UPI002245F945|nr:uncharacterized protein LOC127700774 [Mytilus californianus]XP_052060384.1 uncharacterized protein LOC127700774 [Mytilus californianus]
MPSDNHHFYKHLSSLLFLFLGILVILILSLYTKVDTLQSNTQSLLEKVNQLETESNEKFSNLVRETKSCTSSIQRIKRNEERMIDTSNKISDILLSVGSIRNDFETNITKMKEMLSKEKSDLDYVVKKIETVITEQNNVRTMKEEMITVKRSIEQCLTLKDDVIGNADRLRNVNMQMEKFNIDSSILQQKHNRFSQKIHDNYKKMIQLKTFTQKYVFDNEAYMHSSFEMLKKDVEKIYQNISAIDINLSTGLIMLDNFKLLVETVQQVKITKMEVKLDKTQHSFSSLLTEVKTHGEEISTILERLQTLKKTTEILSMDIGGKWLLVQTMTVLLVLFVFTICGAQFYNSKTKIGEMEKKIQYLTVNKDKPSLQYESLSIVEQIKRKQPEELENMFCVISFSQETHNKHRRITRPSVEGRLRIKKMDEADFVVTNDKSVLNIPRCKVLLVFVDHNQKDVILETPGEDEEDIKLLTVQACRKIGGDVFVIYVGDEGSESLMAGCLYNPQLTTVAEHFELKQLEQRNRVITCHEKFTITQREKVAQAIA